MPAFWTSARSDVGAIHRADQASGNYCHEHVLVFLHGVNADYLDTWRHTPEWIVKWLNVEIDVFAFSYASKAWHATSVQAAAARLMNDLPRHFPDARNFIFVAHSTGGLVLKEALRQSYAATLAALENKTPQSDASRSSLWIRTRFIINIDVPHDGGGDGLTGFTSLVNRGLGLVLKFAAPLVWLRNSLGKGFGWGTNQIVYQLRYQGPFVKELERAFWDEMKAMREGRFPVPAVWDIKGHVDDAVPDPQATTALGHGITVMRTTYGRMYLQLPGNHTRVKLPESFSDDDPFMLAVCDFLLQRVKVWRSVVTVERTLDRILFNNRLVRVDRLASGSAAPAEKIVLSTRTLAVSQGEAFERLRQLITQEPRRVIVTGGALVGKSSVLRLLARDLCICHGADISIGDTLPFVFLLQDYDIKALKDVKAEIGGTRGLWEYLADEWCARANQIIHGPGMAEQMAAVSASAPAGHAFPHIYTRQWLEDRLRGQSCVVILDGIDEFLLIHPAVRLSHVQSMLDELDRTFSADCRLTVLIGVRLSQHAATRLNIGGALATTDIGTLAGNAGWILVIQPLTDAQVQELFPGIPAVVASVADENIRRIIRIPLIASLLEHKGQELSKLTVLSRTALYGLALDAILEGGGLPLVSDMEGRKIPLAAWRVALAVVARRFFEQFRPSLTHDELQQEAASVFEDWRLHCREHGIEAQGQEVLAAEPIFQSEDALRQLCVRTILVASVGQVGTGAGPHWKIFHREFSNFLISQYLALCIHYRKFGELAKRAHTTAIFQMTGELLEQWSAASGAATVIPADLVVESVRQTMRAGSWFIFGNFGAVIGNARMSIEGPAIDELLSTLESPKSRPGGNPWNSTEVSRLLAVAGGPDIDPTVRHIMLSSWCYRASHDPRVDPFAALFRGGLLRNTLAHTLVDYAFPEGDFEVHPVTRNLAWASLVEFHLLFGTPRPDALPPEAVLKANRAHVDAACNLVFSTTRLSATHFRSFQLGLQLVIQAIGTDPKTGTVINATRAIMAAHYLYVLTSAVFCGRSLLADTPEIVKDALEPGSPLEVCFEQRQQRTLGTLSQPDVCLSLLHVCRDIFAGRISPD